jgi:ABC-2 type transport system ATP-binding protein
MESVEELCDHIALIHKSNKLIEGRLDDVKRQFKTNSFEVGIVSDNGRSDVRYHQKFTVGPANFKSLGKELKLEVVGKCYA